jgi:hypothetical protein
MKTLKDLTPSDLASVYVGRRGECCCGCAGLHTYNPEHRTEASASRGYEVPEDRCNSAEIARVLKLIKTKAPTAEGCTNHYAYETGRKLYIVYLTKAAQAVQDS